MPATMTVACPACRSPLAAEIEQIIDVKRQPQLKAALLSGELNRVRCNACGASNALATPILYHDAGREMLVAYVPPELNLQGAQRDQLVGDMLRDLTARIPREEFRGYMFQPGQALTFQGLVEQILEGDGVTKDMLDAQQERVALLERLTRAEPKQLRRLVREHDAEIDAEFFESALALMQQAARDGQERRVRSLAAVQEAAARHSTLGRKLAAQAKERERIVRDVARRVDALGDSPQRKDLLALALDFADDEQRLQAFVGLLRPALDYPFFQELTLRIGQAPAAERARLEALRDRLGELTRMADAQAQAALQQAAQTLQTIMAAADMDRALRENLALIDDSFMVVLAAAIREAGSRADIGASSKLKSLQQKISALMQENMRPELRLVGEMLRAPDERRAMAMLDEGLKRFGPALVQALSAAATLLQQQGQQKLARRLESLREEARARLKA